MTDYRSAVADALAAGHRFAGLHATNGGAAVRAVLTAPDGSAVVETVEARDRTVPSIVDLAPSAGWDEREAADLYGVRFDGHEPLRPLVEHDLDLSRWTVPVRGADAYQVAVGPIHAGVIESGHFRFHVVGDRILHLDARLFYKHRGLERAAEGRPLAEGLVYAQRACAACAVSNAVAYAHACEEALGLRPAAELARARTILLELERVWSHLNGYKTFKLVFNRVGKLSIISAAAHQVNVAVAWDRLVGVDLDQRGLLLRVVGPDVLDGATVTLGARVGHDDAVLRVADLPHAEKPDTYGHGYVLLESCFG